LTYADKKRTDTHYLDTMKDNNECC